MVTKKWLTREQILDTLDIERELVISDEGYYRMYNV